MGQGLGAGKPERAERAVWLAGLYNMVFLGTAGALFVAFAGPIVGVFTHDPAVAPIAELCLRTISYGFLFGAAATARAPRTTCGVAASPLAP